ncbi:cellulose biosynthesis protein BcsC [Gallaecimonas xiamenensis]|uniref:Cellulose synthase operon C domain-containing protein n=1 Tax=Gallaecimonas xiamenensis 3-C-1 TaxID=745411 RepID=K2KIB1_9GAMM|nr:cellulose biosynthesis protein BcsC [Gallaecimonas xiamenensis]EKE77005.1 cellulose synthase operon C domain-containing protein [Gallaecimonas xiamenensis 3-C-1]
MNKPLLLALACLAGTPPLLAAEGQFDALFQQADFWQSKQRQDLAKDALGRVLAADPANPEALYRLALIAIQEGDKDKADALAERLSIASPKDPRLEELRLAKANTNLDSGALAEARLLAANGQYQEAVARFKTLFSTDQPPASLAVEYYQTLAGTPNGWDQARQGLAQIHQRQPGNLQGALAYGQVLSYRPQSRRQGIAVLASLDGQLPAATTAWRQALLWLDADSNDQPLYAAYAKAHPGDDAVAAHYRQKTTETPGRKADKARSSGYAQLKKGQLAGAAKAFEQALAIRPDDAEARAGLGLVQLRRQQFAKARDSLAQAMRLAPAKKGQWQAAHNSARFYASLAGVRQEADSGQYAKALDMIRPLASQSGPHQLDARLLEADIYSRQGRLDEAAGRYRDLLLDNADNQQARIGLINVLRKQQRWGEANAMAELLPAKDRQQLGDLASGQALMLRERAKAEPPLLAEASLRQAQSLDPADPWIRLDLARLLDTQGRPLAAQVLMNQGLGPDASPQDRYVAALLAKDQNRWDDVARILSPLGSAKRTPAINALLDSAALQARLDEIRRRQAVGDRAGARQLMLDLYNQPPASAAGTGQVANLLLDGGEPAMALLLARQQAQQPLTAAPGDYLDLLLVLVKAGADDEAQSLLGRLSQRRDLGTDDWAAIENIRNAMALVQADRLRQQDRLADAYDLLAARLRLAPNDESLLLAMARLYQSGNKTDKAGQIYRYALKQHPGSQDALTGAVEVAIARNEPEQAEQLLAQLPSDQAQEPTMLLLAAKVARAQGDDDQALALLAQSRQRLFAGQQDQPWLTDGAGLAEAGNPFARGGAPGTDESANPWHRPDWLPGGKDDSQSHWDEEADTANPSLVAQIDSLAREIRRDGATTLSADLQFRSRNGESGLGRLDEVKAPITLQTRVGGGRLSAQVTPTYLNAGAPAGGNSRFGSGVVGSAAANLNTSLDAMPAALDGIEETAYSYDQARQAAADAQAIYLASLGDANSTPIQQAQYLANANQAAQAEAQAKRSFDRATRQDLLKAIGLSSQNLSSSDLQLLEGYLGPLTGQNGLSSASLQAFLDSREDFEAMLGTLRASLNGLVRDFDDPPVQHDAGLALSLAYQWDQLALDIGTTPLGFEKVNLVGGLAWSPQLDRDLQLDLALERRAVTDSVLSYAGTKDPYSGITWGAVTRNGLSAGLGYDDGDLGLYAKLGGYRYQGTNVYSNNAFDLSLGGYLRPINDQGRQLQAGVHVSFQAFDKNMSHYGLGHGGYFSPQDYVAIAFPVSYSEQHDRYDFSLKLAPGFQSFTEKAVDYFPDDPELQRMLDLFAGLGLVEASRYGANSESGFGLSLGAEGQYRFSPRFTLGGRLGFDSFGNYNETTAQLYLRYLMGITND